MAATGPGLRDVLDDGLKEWRSSGGATPLVGGRFRNEIVGAVRARGLVEGSGVEFPARSY